jgi:DNA mismatch endonuclease, patch repair protein
VKHRASEDVGRVDSVSKSVRSGIMSRVRSKDTKPELIVRQIVYALGCRYRLHVKGIPGNPDLVFRSRKKVILVHGCFWHGHSCARGKRPSSNMEFWEEKLSKNEDRDKRIVAKLLGLGWGVLTVWECETRNADDLTARLRKFLNV